MSNQEIFPSLRTGGKDRNRRLLLILYRFTEEVGIPTGGSLITKNFITL